MKEEVLGEYMAPAVFLHVSGYLAGLMGWDWGKLSESLSLWRRFRRTEWRIRIIMEIKVRRVENDQDKRECKEVNSWGTKHSCSGEWLI